LKKRRLSQRQYWIEAKSMRGYSPRSMILATDMQFFHLAVSYKIELAGGQRRLQEAILYVASHGQPMIFFWRREAQQNSLAR
jgi:hypothetical protein